jgi:hypothetical protein
MRAIAGGFSKQRCARRLTRRSSGAEKEAAAAESRLVRLPWLSTHWPVKVSTLKFAAVLLGILLLAPGLAAQTICEKARAALAGAPTDQFWRDQVKQYCPAQAPDMRSAMARCAAVTSSLERLDCFDTLARSSGGSSRNAARAPLPTIPTLDWEALARIRVIEANRPAQTTSAAPGPTPALAIIQAKCEKDWPADFQMRAFCEKQQLEAVQHIAARSAAGTMQTTNGQRIQTKCARDWPSDFQMLNVCVEQQLKALAGLSR